MPEKYGSFGRIVGTLPERRRLRRRVKSTSVLPNWSWAEAIEQCGYVAWKRSELFPIDYFAKDQDGRGSCNFYMQAAMTERILRDATGIYCKLSPEYGYAQVVDGRDYGSLLSESLQSSLQKGLPPYLSRHYAKIRKRDFTAADAKNALYFRGFEWEPIDTWKQAFIALVCGFPVGVAIHAGQNYERIQTAGKYRGFCGVDNGRGNHAVLLDKPVVINGIPGAEQPGSWGVNIHKNGIAVLHEGHFKQTIGYHQFYIATGLRFNRPEIERRFKSHIVYP